MSTNLKEYFSPIVSSVNTVKKYLSDRLLITDLISKLVITFAVVLIIGGLYLIITDPPGSTLSTQAMVSSISWIPGIPFFMGNLANLSAVAAGLAYWFIGIDLLLVGMGLWVRHKVARIMALMIFLLAALFQFVEFVSVGILGAPAAFIGLCLNVIFLYLLAFQFDSLTRAEGVPVPNLS
jgi:lysylphosphatidylglycerol synthetase-like protein (DUF2156 family)